MDSAIIPGPSSVVLSDFAANADRVLSVRQSASFIWELMLYSLLREEVLIQDEALVLSSKFAEIFRAPSYTSVLDELFEMGTLVVLTYPTDAYPTPDLQDLSRTCPMQARSQYIQRYTTKGAKPFTPTPKQLKVHEDLDRILSGHSTAQRRTGLNSKVDIFDRFSNVMSGIVVDRRYRPWMRTAFRGLTNRLLDDFAAYCANPERAIERIRNSRMEPRPGPKLQFTRSLAYQVAETYSPQEAKASQRLMQTVFAYVFNEREKAVGRYSSVLRELMVPAETQLEVLHDLKPGITIDAVVKTPLRLPLPAPGFSSVIAEVRRSDAGRRLREAVKKRSTRAFEEQCDAWMAVSHELARRTSKFRRVNAVSILATLPGQVKSVVNSVIVEGIYRHCELQSPNVWKALFAERAIALGLAVTGDLFKEITGRWYENQDYCRQLEELVYFRCTDLTS